MTTPLKVVEPQAQADGPGALVQAEYERLRRGWEGERFPSVAARRDRLERLLRLLRRHADDIIEAIDADFGGRSRHETLLADVFTTAETVRHALRRVRRWMKPQRVAPQWFLRPATAWVEWQPLGVAAIIAPWNYPVNTALAPLAGALAAGCRVLLKPSEMTPRTAELLARLLRESYAADEVSCVTGGPDVARAIVAAPLDHVLFTGSTRIGREVARAAAENLTPVTLELGGKSPAIIHPEYPIERAAERVAAGKLFNAGQTCIGADYVLLPRGREGAFIAAFKAQVETWYPDLARNPDYTAMATAAGLERMKALTADAESKGASVEVVCPGPLPEAGSRKFAPTIVQRTTDAMRLAQEEIFGPILPIVPYDRLDDAIAYVNTRPRPLALYYFDDNVGRARSVLQQTVSGGACLNETLLHFAQEELPFGGVGASGLGRYHGFDGFAAFSHKKGVYRAGPVNPTRWLHAPPYKDLLEWTLRLFMGSRPRGARRGSPR